MAEVKRKYTPRWAKCSDCGAPIWRTCNAKHLCDECREKHEQIRIEKNRIWSREYQRKLRAKRKQERAVPPSPLQPGAETRCTWSNTCKYGGDWRSICNYSSLTGQLRTIRREKDGRVVRQHMIIDGKCDLYEKRKRKYKNGWKKIAEQDYERKTRT